MLTCINCNYCILDRILCAGVGVTSVSASQLCCRGKQLLRTLGSRKLLAGARQEQQGSQLTVPQQQNLLADGPVQRTYPQSKDENKPLHRALQSWGVPRTPVRDKVITSQELQLHGKKKKAPFLEARRILITQTHQRDASPTKVMGRKSWEST